MGDYPAKTNQPSFTTGASANVAGNHRGPLCAFLGVPVPDTPFPNVNDRAEVKKLISGLTLGACGMLGAGTVVAARPIHLADKYLACAHRNSFDQQRLILLDQCYCRKSAVTPLLTQCPLCHPMYQSR